MVGLTLHNLSGFMRCTPMIESNYCIARTEMVLVTFLVAARALSRCGLDVHEKRFVNA